MADCTVCGKPAGPLMSMCQACIDESRARAKDPSGGSARAVATRSPTRAAQSAAGSGLLGWGNVLVFAGIAMGLYSYFMDTTVAGGQFDLDRVHNLGLLSTRVELAIFAGFLFLSGIGLIAAAEIVGQLYRQEAMKARGSTAA